MSEALRAGYMLTEVGVIPEDWTIVPLSQTTKRITRGASPRPIENPLWFDSRSLVGWVRISDVTRSGRYLMETKQKLSEEGVRRSRAVPSGSLIMSICATVGRPIETKIDVCIHDGFVVFDQPAVEQSYLYHVLSSLEPTWSKHGQTGSQMNLNTSLINACLIPLPTSKIEQRAIAAALSDIDALIAKLDELITKKRNIKQATMQQLLTGQTRLPGFSGEWEVKRLGDVSEIAMGRTPRRLNSAYWGTGYKWLSIADLKAKIIYNSKEEITSLAAAEMTIIPKGTLLMSFKLSIGRLAFAGCDLYTNEAICSFNKLHANADFLYYILGRVDFSLYGKQAVKGYTLNKESLKQVEVTLPSMDEQTAIAAALSDMDTELATLETRREKTLALKQGMMQELLTGRIRLK
jgi:type I restriction enzyme S subunit